MGPPKDEALLRDMLDHARRAVAAVSGKERADLDSDFILGAALDAAVDHDIVWDVVAGDLTAVIGALEQLLADESAAE